MVIKMDIMSYILIGFQAIGIATIVFRSLEPMVKATQFTWDDNFVKKGLNFLTWISKVMSLNKDNSEIKIKLK